MYAREASQNVRTPRSVKGFAGVISRYSIHTLARNALTARERDASSVARLGFRDERAYSAAVRVL
jgi:hypothetical protein